MDRLEAVVQPYDWGSRYVIAELQGRQTPSPGPEAELWVGAHPAAPALLEREEGLTTLHRVITADAPGELGPRCHERFGDRLPFLLKILAVEKALSIQVHPTREQAAEGFAREEAAGIAPRDPTRNYKDDWPKPEILMALTPFEALAGFRPAQESARLLALLEVPELDEVERLLRDGGQDGRDGRLEALTRLLHWPAAQRQRLTADVEWRCGELAEDESLDAQDRATFGVGVRIARQYPRDMGLVCALLLQHVTLQPGEAIYLAAGGLHCYLQGTGVELLANSDNVVRAGLTSKHIDVDELLRLLDPTVVVPRLQPVPVAPDVVRYETPAPEFELDRCLVDGECAVPGDGGPRLLLCLGGDLVLVDGDGAELHLSRGDTAYAGAGDGGLRLRGRGDVVVGSMGA
ncbi:mannose-6-phosphate isomerase, class I [Arsenicicoccus dermatophilus]|uniref:mannose-6-phosphate isomerase, class I n=1 Tax=Arsenicicoccus dermatophilus TaxID=1076331 RepID=UPI003916D398